MSVELRDAFIELISNRTGLTFKASDQDNIAQKIMARVSALDCPFPEAYYRLLSDCSSEESRQRREQEWRHLSELLTNGESFFFRDRGQFSVLERHILPALIQRNATKKTLRICSAGCATGEEAYSIAILLSTLIADIDAWNILVYGVDLNPASIARAKEGLYRPWSLRGLSSLQKKTYFHSANQHYQIAPRFKTWVRFQRLNLVEDALDIQADADTAFPGQSSGQFDLIVCRNVFIYFTKNAIATVVNKFHRALRPGGYFLAGHSELYEQNLEAFHIEDLPGSLVLQRPDMDATTSARFDVAIAEAQKALAGRASGIETAAGGDSVARVDNAYETDSTYKADSAYETDSAIATAFQYFQAAQIAFQNSDFDQALHQAEQALSIRPNDLKTLMLMAKINMSIGQLDTAKRHCHKALKIDSCFMPPHYILAKIFANKDNLPAAKRILKKIICLDPSAVVAYLELSQIYKQENNLKKSTLMRQSALKIFRRHLSPSAISDAAISDAAFSELSASVLSPEDFFED
ncbi:MAG: CheR family methyltransferase [Phormidesmis sp.]